MRGNFYIVVIEKGGILDAFNDERFHKKLISANGVVAWWHYLNSTYILRVRHNVNATAIADYIRTITPNKEFFVGRLDLSDHNGWLPQEAWDWINNQK